MLYVLIPCLILLVVALILKKRESANTDVGPEKSKKVATKKTPKKFPTRSSNSVQTETENQSTVKVIETRSTPLNENFKATIEKLIQAKSYSAAEAQINQALNQDSSFHELYFYLLDIHIAQNDDLATKQLINYLKSLGLYEVADQIILKKNAAKLHSNHIPENSNLNSLSGNNSTAAFDALIDHKVEHIPTPVTPAVPYELNLNKEVNGSDIQPLEFSIEKPKPEAQSIPLEFSFTSSEATKITEQPIDTVENITAKTVPVDDIKPLEFSFDLAPKIEEKSSTPVAPSFDHDDLIFETKTPISKSQVENVKVEPATTDINNEFNFDLNQHALNSTASNNFEFKLDTPVSTTRSTFEYDPNEFKADLPVIAAETHTDTDPLAQSFPELLSTNEVQLNLDLAQQYIKLGAYDAATRLINEKSAQYSTEQRSYAEKLLNQLAS